jgi:hypothetical protein
VWTVIQAFGKYDPLEIAESRLLEGLIQGALGIPQRQNILQKASRQVQHVAAMSRHFNRRTLPNLDGVTQQSAAVCASFTFSEARLLFLHRPRDEDVREKTLQRSLITATKSSNTVQQL